MKKHSLLKDLVFVFLIAAIFVKVDDFAKKYDYDFHKFADAYDKDHKLGKYSETQTVPYVEDNVVDKTNTSTNETVNKSSNKIVYVHGFGDYTQSDLESVRQGVQDFYGMTAVIGSPYNPSGEYFLDGSSYVLAYKVLSMEYNSNVGPGYHIYVTDHPLCQSDEITGLISGRARYNTKLSVMSTYQMKQNGNYGYTSLVHTATHEMGHNFGLDHCDNPNCLMKSHGLDTREFCSNCKIKLNR